MFWTKTAPHQKDTLLDEIKRVTTITENSVIAPSSVTLLLDVVSTLQSGTTNDVLAENLKERARVSPLFRNLYLASASAIASV